MPITPPNSPRVNTGGASNTDCLVLVHTHDRGPNHASAKIDLSQYIVSVGVSQHLSGGGAADITLPAVDFIEDVLAAGDLVNIYFNTNRGDLDLYNRGRVRSFFGYIESITRSVSVTGTGSKTTTYNIACRDFGKASKTTEIYHNPHMSHQTQEKNKGVVRKDVRANLGGIALLSKGMAIEGTPRQIILQSLMRLFGFGGQWALPPSYRESLPGSAITLFEETEKGKQSFANDLQSARYAVIEKGDDATKEEFIKVLSLLAKEAIKQKKSSSQLWEEYVTFKGDNASKLITRVQAIANKYRYNSFVFSNAKNSKSGKLGFINNTFFKIQGVSNSEVSRGMASSKPDVVVSREEQRLKEDLDMVIKRVLQEVQGFDNNVINEFGAFPKANQFAQAFSEDKADAYKTDVYTIFNILCLDYLEPVGGYWPSASNIFFQGALHSLLERAANSSMNELFFDLRPSPLFKPETHDGLGVPLAGAIPMVPAVVLRQKPFTNYPVPNREITNKDIDGSLVVGGIKKGDGSGAYSDQLVMNSGGGLGDFGPNMVKGTQKNQKEVSGQLKKLGTSDVSQTTPEQVGLKNVVPPPPEDDRSWFTEVTDTLGDLATSIGQGFAFLFAGDTPPPAPDPVEKYNDDLEKLSAKIAKGGKYSNQDIVDMYNKSIAAPFEVDPSSVDKQAILALGKKDSSLVISRKQFANVVTLPRPIFRSPDNNRITKELYFSQSQYLLGVQEVDKSTGKLKNTFSAFSTPDFLNGVDAKGLTGSTSFVDAGGKPVKDTNTLGLLAQGSSMYDINDKLSEANNRIPGKTSDEYTYHVLDYCTIRDVEVVSESYSRGDFAVNNIVEYWGSVPGDRDAQRLFLGTMMPLVTPISVYRFGIRLHQSSTEHVQSLITGEVSLDRQKDTLLSWAVLQDMWMQHNHEYLNGRLSTRGLPGVRPGYRVDRPELNLSFYVESVQHNWQHPGTLTTQISVSRGQPSGANNALKYHTPRPKSDPATSSRQELGQVFSTSEFEKGGQSYKLNTPGTYTGSKSVGRQIPPTKRDKLPKVGKDKPGG